MKRVVFLAVLAGLGTLAAGPLHEEDRHFISYKALCIASATLEMEMVLEQCKKSQTITLEQLESMECCLKTVYLNLGYMD